MNTTLHKAATEETPRIAMNGWGILMLNLILFFGAVAWFVLVIVSVAGHNEPERLWVGKPILLSGSSPCSASAG